MGKILVINGTYYANAVEGIREVSFDIDEFRKSPDSFDLLLFTGGSDISPELYGHTSPKGLCHTNPVRDEEEVELFNIAVEFGIPVTGICRGCQLLNALNGGTLIHDLDNHSGAGNHNMMTNTEELPINVTSLHHQMCIVGNDGYVIGWSEPRLATEYYGDNDELVDYNGPEVEAIYYPKTKCFAVQYHPEFMSDTSPGYNWYKNGVEDLLTMSENEFKTKYCATKTFEFSG